MKITLAMIVKNESKVIVRALLSVMHLIDSFVIFDTGSEDDTPQIAQACLAGIPGHIEYGEFEDFAMSRTKYLELAREKFPESDYVLVMDADEVMINTVFSKDQLTEDMYSLSYLGDNDYRYPVIFRNSKPFYYKYPTHEIPVCDEPYTSGTLDSLVLDHRHDGGTINEKYDRDVRLISSYLKSHPGDPRMTFYLANSYWDMGSLILAKEYYLSRATMGGWSQEVFVSYYKAAIASLQLGYESDFVKYSLAAFYACPDRMDSLYELGKFYNSKSMYTVADIFLAKSSKMEYPSEPLFFSKAIYQYLIDIEYAVCSYYLGDNSKAVEYNQSVICCDNAPKWAKELATKNLSFSLTTSIA